MPAVVNEDICIGCGACSAFCPNDAISVSDKASVDAERCVDCGNCEGGCPVGAIYIRK